MNRRTFLSASIGAGLALAVRAQSESNLRVGVIGHTGKGGYGHGLDTMWLRLPETEIVGVADPDEKGLAAAKAKLKVERGFADYRQMLAELKPDLVAIGPREITWHRDMCMAAAEAGARGIYIEKPFCRTLAEADEIIAACDKHGTRLAIAHRNRYHPTLPVIEKLLAEGAIGRLVEIRTRGKEDARGGALDLWVLGSHVLNVATFFSGPAVACSAMHFQNGKPVTKADLKEGGEGVGLLGGNEVHARFETKSGVPVFFDSIATAGERPAGFGVQLIGTKGTIDFRMDNVPVAHLFPGSQLAPSMEARAWVPITTAGIGKPEPIADLKDLVMQHTLAARDLIAAIREKREPLCSARDGRALIEMILGTFESHRRGGARVAFPLEVRENPFAQL